MDRKNRCPRVLLTCALCAALFGACSDDTGTLQPDAGRDHDAGPLDQRIADHPVTDGTTPDLRGDQSPAPDQGPPICDPRCTDPTRCVFDPNDPATCWECKDDTHCLGNPFAWGPKCYTLLSYCVCDTDADCMKNLHGRYCDPKNAQCGCKSNADCTHAPYTACSNGECEKPCSSSADCPTKAAPRCDKPSGRCMACLGDADCPSSGAPKCDQASGRCVACLADGDCAGDWNASHCDLASKTCLACLNTGDCAANQYGGTCASSTCTCASDADCGTTSYAWGKVCLTSQGRCGCTGPADCSGNPNGPTCYAKYSKCSCQSDGDCQAPHSKCAVPYAGATYKHCRKPCTTDAGCRVLSGGGDDLGLRKCVSGACEGCTTNADCKGNTSGALCHPTLKACVSCISDGDCPSSTPVCHGTGVCGVCKDDAGCAGSPAGLLCDGGGCTCAANTDCAGSTPFGPTCIPHFVGAWCGCDTDADCTGNPHGPTCNTDLHTCSCASGSECTAPGLTVCSQLQAGSLVKHCAAPCTKVSDCSDVYWLRGCDAGTCVGCKSNADCVSPDPWSKLCNTTTVGCVECLKDTDCTASSSGNTCVNSWYCSCAKNADCASNLHGKLCDPINEACSCLIDADCPSGRTCSGASSGMLVCK